MPDTYTQEKTKQAITDYSLQGPVLDVGSGEFSGWFRPMFDEAGLAYSALDMQEGLPGVDIVAQMGFPGTDFPEELRGKYGTVLLLSVLEHASFPHALICDSAACLRPGGHMILAAPMLWPHHAYPQDMWRILSDGARFLIAHAGLELLTIEGQNGLTNYHLGSYNQWFSVARKPE